MVHGESYTREEIMVAAGGSISIALTVGALIGAAPFPVGAVPQTQDDQLEARVWLDRGDEPVLRRGERVRVYYRSTADAFVAILNIDTDGTTRLLFPRSPDENHYVRGGRDYQLIFPNSPAWHVEDRPGIGYFFIVTSREPFDFSALRYSRFDGGWDMSLVSRQVYTDPYVAVDDLVAHLIPDWEYADYALDFATYHVDQRQSYPRFLCYECHGFRPYTVWNPYAYSCTSFRVVIYDDPYYYPSYRYRGNRVVYSRPIAPGVPRYQFKERAAGEVGTPDIRRRATPGRTPPSASQARTSAPVGRAGSRPGYPRDPPNSPSTARHGSPYRHAAPHRPAALDSEPGSFTPSDNPRAPACHRFSATDQTHHSSGDRQTDAGPHHTSTRKNPSKGEGQGTSPHEAYRAPSREYAQAPSDQQAAFPRILIDIAVRSEAREEATPRGLRVGRPVPTKGAPKDSRRSRSPVPLRLVIFLVRRS